MFRIKCYSVHRTANVAIPMNYYHQELKRVFLASYCYEQHISILSGYLWKKNDCYSFDSISDDTNHTSEATWAAIQHILYSLKNHTTTKITNLNFISDSPVSQFRNKTTFYFLKQHAMSNNMTV